LDDGLVAGALGIATEMLFAQDETCDTDDRRRKEDHTRPGERAIAPRPKTDSLSPRIRVLADQLTVHEPTQIRGELRRARVATGRHARHRLVHDGAEIRRCVGLDLAQR